jgi:hypothetical protein
MERFERDLKQMLARREPAADFTARVMAGVQAAAAKTQEPVEFPGSRAVRQPQARRPPVFRWAAVGAMAASLAFGALALRHQRAERRAAQQAEAQLMESLSVAGSKISQARDKVWGAPRGD